MKYLRRSRDVISSSRIIECHERSIFVLRIIELARIVHCEIEIAYRISEHTFGKKKLRKKRKKKLMCQKE